MQTFVTLVITILIIGSAVIYFNPTQEPKIDEMEMERLNVFPPSESLNLFQKRSLPHFEPIALNPSRLFNVVYPSKEIKKSAPDSSINFINPNNITTTNDSTKEILITETLNQNYLSPQTPNNSEVTVEKYSKLINNAIQSRFDFSTPSILELLDRSQPNWGKKIEDVLINYRSLVLELELIIPPTPYKEFHREFLSFFVSTRDILEAIRNYEEDLKSAALAINEIPQLILKSREFLKLAKQNAE